MRLIHLMVGVGTVVLFLITGQLMRHHTPPMGALSDAARLLYRSRHIYILASGLVNLMLGLYVRTEGAGWRRAVQQMGSGLLLISAVELTMAFVAEPEAGFQPDMPWSSIGLYSLFGGAMMHLASAVSARGVEGGVNSDPQPARSRKGPVPESRSEKAKTAGLPG